jgi:CARDB
MRLPTIAGVIALVACAPAVAAADPPRAALRGFVCQPALDPPARAISIQAVMRPLPGTQKLSVRFQLLITRKSPTPVTVVRAGDLGTWISPQDPTLGEQPGDIWRISKPVANLVAPAAYRFRVTFRWTGSNGRLLGTAVRLSAICVQPERRPDLLVKSITVRSIAGRPSQDDYIALIRNAGATAAGPFGILFAPGEGFRSTTLTVTRLRAGGTLRETFVGPLCTSRNAPTITVDPTDQVDDFNRSNNSLTATCSKSRA